MKTVEIKCPVESCGKIFEYKTNDPNLIRNYNWWKAHAAFCPECRTDILFRLEMSLSAKAITALPTTPRSERYLKEMKGMSKSG